MPPQRVALRCCLQAQVVMLPALYRCSFYMEWSRGSGRKLFWKYPARSLEGEGRDINEPDGAFHSAHGHSHAVESDPWCSSPDRWGLGEVFSAQMWWQQKRLTATAFQLRAVNLDCKGRKLTIADSTFSMYSIACFPRIVKENWGFAMDIRFCSLILDKCPYSWNQFPWTVWCFCLTIRSKKAILWLQKALRQAVSPFGFGLAFVQRKPSPAGVAVFTFLPWS